MSYEYVKRTYGHDPIPGNRVKHTETRKFGRITREKTGQGHYVMVQFDGRTFASPCHPDALDYFPVAKAVTT